MDLIRSGRAAAGVALAGVVGAVLFALPGCAPGTHDAGSAASPEVIREPGVPSEPKEQAKLRLAVALDRLLRSALPAATFTEETPPTNAPPVASPVHVRGDRVAYLAKVVVVDAAGWSSLSFDIGPKPDSAACYSGSSGIGLTPEPEPVPTEQRPDGTILFAEENLNKDPDSFSVILAGAYRADRTCVRILLDNGSGAILADGTRTKPTRSGGLPLGGAQLAALAADASLTVFPPGFEDLK
jgi:hypothetical protein